MGSWCSHAAIVAALSLVALACAPRPDSGTLNAGRSYPQEPVGGQDLKLAAADLPHEATRLRLGVTPYASVEQTESDLAPLLTYLQGALGVPVDLVQASNYRELIQFVADRHVDVAMLSPVSYVQAKRIAPSTRLVARSLTHGATDYAAYLIVRSDDAARNLSDLRNKRVAWVDPLSSTGYLYPYAALLDHGLDPAQLFRSQRFVGTHDGAIDAVLKGEADVAAVASGIFERLGRNQRSDIDRGNLRVLHKAGRIPYDALVVEASVPYGGATKIGQAFLALSTRTAEGRRILAPTWAISGWIPAEDSVYDSVRRTLNRVGPAAAAIPSEAGHGH